MNEIAFYKYSLYGNTFTLIDESEKTILSETDKSRFARFATDNFFGIGSDNLIVLQKCTPSILRSIDAARKYWRQPQTFGEADYIFRMFEPDGKEAFSCGNGVMCIADHLFRKSHVKSCRIVTQIPTEIPKVIEVGHDTSGKLAWANLGAPTKPPEEMAKIKEPLNTTDALLEIKEIPFLLQDLHFNGSRSTHELKVSGHVIFTGEPHLVVFTDAGLSIPQLTDAIFVTPNCCEPQSIRNDLKATDSSWLVHNIGARINQNFKDLFPYGINVNLVRVVDPCGTLEFRCFERGIGHETLACGTGAVAASVVTQALNICGSEEILVWPHRCRWYYPESQF